MSTIEKFQALHEKRTLLADEARRADEGARAYAESAAYSRKQFHDLVDGCTDDEKAQFSTLCQQFGWTLEDWKEIS